MFFQPFPHIAYKFDINGVEQLRVIKDIALNVRFRQVILNRSEIFDEYVVDEGKSPELISEELYGTPLYHWTILLINNRFDRFEDFPVSEEVLASYVIKKYRQTPLDTDEEIMYAPKQKFGGTLYRTDLDNIDCDKGTPFSHEVTNWEYERNLNEEKRKILVLHPSVIDDVTAEIYDLFVAYNAKQ